jgi:aspartate kinase
LYGFCLHVIRIFKFGGASVRDAAGVRNVARIIEKMGGDSSLVVVVSAMGKTTNALENIYHLARCNEPFEEALRELKVTHENIAAGLFPEDGGEIGDALARYFLRLRFRLLHAALLPYDQGYDQVVSTGEYLSSLILFRYLLSRDLPVTLINAARLIRTDKTWREGEVQWPETEKLIRREAGPILQQGIVLTQGFLGGCSNGSVTTLGREGSDYTAALLGAALQAESVTIWKDVPGVLNADPRWIQEAVLLPELSYQDAAELTYYGATVIHPKTIRPLARQSIPLYVRSFLDPEAAGTRVSFEAVKWQDPAFIRKSNQTLVSLTSRDFSFMDEKNSTEVIHLFSQAGFKIQMLQVSATSISVVTDSKKENLEQVFLHLKNRYTILFNENLTLYTIKNYSPEAIDFVKGENSVILDQRSRNTCQLLIRTT